MTFKQIIHQIIMESIELVVFENVSVIHPKKLSLPFEKVSLRQVLIIYVRMLGGIVGILHIIAWHQNKKYNQTT